jgi:hypothetical protein
MKTFLRVCLVFVLTFFSIEIFCAGNLFAGDRTIKVYDEKDIDPFGNPNIGAKPTRVIETDGETLKVYDKKDIDPFGTPNIGAKPVQAIETDGNTLKVYDEKDIDLFGNPNIGAKPTRVIETEDE